MEIKIRQGIIEKFSTFLLFVSSNNSPRYTWQENYELKKNMEKMIDLNPNADEKFFVEHWLETVSPDNRLARLHLSAYLEEACYYAAISLFRQFTAEDLSMIDFFQIARQKASNPKNILKNYDPTRSRIEVYAQLKLKSAMLDYIRKGRGRDFNKYSDWALLRSLSKKVLQEALQKAGINEPYLSRCVLAWQAFREIYTPQIVRANSRLQPPTLAQFADMTAYYKEQLQLAKHQKEAVSSSDIQNWLKVCVNTVRESTKVEYYYIDVDNPDLELSIANKSQEQDIYLDEQVGVSEQWQQLKTVLIEALARLPNEGQKMLFFKYGVKFTQLEIAKVFNIQQYQVSRQLQRYKRPLLEALVDWSQRHLQIQVSVEKIDEISSGLDEWLISYYQERLIGKIQKTGVLQEIKNKFPVLYHYYHLNLPLKEVSVKFKISDSDIDEKLKKEKQNLQDILQVWVQSTLELPTIYVKSAAKSIATLIEEFLSNEPSSIFQIEQR